MFVSCFVTSLVGWFKIKDKLLIVFTVTFKSNFNLFLFWQGNKKNVYFENRSSDNKLAFLVGFVLDDR